MVVRRFPPRPAAPIRSAARIVSEDELEGELQLARSTCGPAIHSEARAAHDVGGQAEIHQVEGVEELGAKLQGDGFGVAAAREWCVLHQGDVEVAVAWSAEGVAS